MDAPTQTFHRLRPRLQAIAYRMLGSSAEAEEVVQDAWLRWHEAEQAAIETAEAWLVTVTTRLAIDRLRAAKVQREHYVGFWLPEPLLSDGPATPEQLLARADELSVAFLALLERLSPEARAAFLRRESTLFSARERAALAWTEALTRLPDQGVPDEIYESVRTQFSEAELSDLSFVIVGINGWNRLCIGFRAVPGSADKAFGLDKAGLG